jgi:uncharacterized protein
MNLLERFTFPGPKRILSLDGGGIRGALTLGFLEKIEEILCKRYKKENFRLCDYFDLIGGTSTGAIIAGALVIGMKASEIKQMYLDLGGEIFGAKKLKFWEALFKIKPLEDKLIDVFKELTLGDPTLKTGLCIVSKRADTRSTWPLINHPNGKYYSKNKGILLRKAVRSSTAAPTFFVPEKFDVGEGEVGAFIDGGVSMANNPALQLFLVATLKGFPFHWPTGENNLLLVSVGTGCWHQKDEVETVLNSKLWNWAMEIPSMLMEDANWQNQLLLQYLSHSKTPWLIDREIGDLSQDLLTSEPVLSYLRYNAILETNELQAHDCADLVSKLKSLKGMSAAENRYDLSRIGEKFAEKQVKQEHFPISFDIVYNPKSSDIVYNSMKLLDFIEIRGGQQKRIELYQGDLTDLSVREGFDLLIVSAFPNDYLPTPTSLIGALHRKGLSVEVLAINKDVDLRESFSCWLSKEFTPQNPGLQFRRILCFEPLFRGRPPEIVGDIFRALTPILAEKTNIKTIALPVVATGNQGYTVAEMLSPLLEAALHWLEAGLPLDCIKIFTHSHDQAQEAQQIFSDKKSKYFRSTLTSKPQIIDYDIFISYSRENASESEVMEQALRQSRPSIRIFVDRKEIDIGAGWQPEIFESLDRCHKVVAMLSPDYLGSKVCKEEFNIAWIRSRETDKDVIFPVYLYTTELPTYMKYRNYIDCREGDKSKIGEACKKLLAALDRI